MYAIRSYYDFAHAGACVVDQLALERVDEPVVEGAVVLELQGADGVGDPLQGVGEGMGEVVHRVDAPALAGAVVGDALDAVDDRVA